MYNMSMFHVLLINEKNKMITSNLGGGGGDTLKEVASRHTCLALKSELCVPVFVFVLTDPGPGPGL